MSELFTLTGTEWVRILSWHIRKLGAERPLCGNLGPVREVRAGDRPEGRTCEACYRRVF